MEPQAAAEIGVGHTGGDSPPIWQPRRIPPPVAAGFYECPGITAGILEEPGKTGQVVDLDKAAP